MQLQGLAIFVDRRSGDVTYYGPFPTYDEAAEYVDRHAEEHEDARATVLMPR